MPLHCKTVGEGDLAARRVSRLGPVSQFEQHRFQQADFDDFTADAVDFHPIAHADSILSHQFEPAEKGNDEVLHDDGKPGGRQPDDRGHLSRGSHDDKQDKQAPTT